MSDHAEKTPALMATKAKRRTSLQAPGDARFKTLPPAQQIFGLQSNQAVQGMVGGGNVLANGTTSNGITRTPETKWVHAGPRSSNEIVELNATIGGVYIQSARVDIADDLLRGYSRNIATRLAAIEAFSSFQRELQEEFPITSWLVTRFTSDLPESKDAPANLARANAYIRKADYRAAVDFLGAAENEVNQLVKASSGYQESQDLATDRFIAGLQGAKIAGGIAVGVLTAGSGTAAVAAVGAGYAAVQEASEQAMKVYLGLIREIDWEGIIVDAVINLAIGKLMTGLTRFSRGKEFARQFGKVAPWSFRNIPEQEIREFAIRTGKFLLSKQTVTEILIAKLTSLLQMSLKTSYDTVRGRENGKGFVETLKVRFSAMLFDERGDIDFQSIFFQAFADALGSATNRAAVSHPNPLPNEPPIEVRKVLTSEERQQAWNLLKRSVGTAQEGLVEVVKFPSTSKKTETVLKQNVPKKPDASVAESTGLADRGWNQSPDLVTVQVVKGKNDSGRVVRIEVPNYNELPKRKRGSVDNVLGRAMKAAGMLSWGKDDSHIQALEHRGTALPYNHEPLGKKQNRGTKGVVTHRTLELEFTQFQEKNPDIALGRVVFDRKLKTNNALQSESIQARDTKGNVVFDMERRGRDLVDKLSQ